MFMKNIPLWLSLILALLPPLYIILIVLCLHCTSVLCSLSILLKRILRLLTISSPPSFNHSALHSNLPLALLFFQFVYNFFNHFLNDTFYLICFSYQLLKLFIYFFFYYPFTFIIWFSGFQQLFIIFFMFFLYI